MRAHVKSHRARAVDICFYEKKEQKIKLWTLEPKASLSLLFGVRLGTEMSQQNPIQALLKTCENFAQCIQTHLSHFVGHKDDSGNASQNPRRPLFSLSSKPINPITSDDASTALHSEQEAPPYPISLQKVCPCLWFWMSVCQ